MIVELEHPTHGENIVKLTLSQLGLGIDRIMPNGATIPVELQRFKEYGRSVAAGVSSRFIDPGRQRSEYIETLKGRGFVVKSIKEQSA